MCCISIVSRNNRRFTLLCTATPRLSGRVGRRCRRRRRRAERHRNNEEGPEEKPKNIRNKMNSCARCAVRTRHPSLGLSTRILGRRAGRIIRNIINSPGARAGPCVQTTGNEVRKIYRAIRRTIRARPRKQRAREGRKGEKRSRKKKKKQKRKPQSQRVIGYIYINKTGTFLRRGVGIGVGQTSYRHNFLVFFFFKYRLPSGKYNFLSRPNE